MKIYQRLLQKNGLKFMINQKESTLLTSKLGFKTSMLRSDVCDFSDAYIVVKGNITVTKKHLLLMTLMHLIIQQVT